jgi:phage shock protein C
MNNFKSTFWGVILIAIGGLFLLDEILPDIDFHRFVFPILLIIGGALLIFRDKFKNNNGGNF